MKRRGTLELGNQREYGSKMKGTLDGPERLIDHGPKSIISLLCLRSDNKRRPGVWGKTLNATADALGNKNCLGHKKEFFRTHVPNHVSCKFTVVSANSTPLLPCSRAFLGEE